MQTQSVPAAGSSDQAYPLATVGALIEHTDGRILIVQTTKWRGTWGVPGGKVDLGEPLETALKREMMEEVGLDIYDIRFALLQGGGARSSIYEACPFCAH
jgi:nucleoside triphosphatase